MTGIKKLCGAAFAAGLAVWPCAAEPRPRGAVSVIVNAYDETGVRRGCERDTIYAFPEQSEAREYVIARYGEGESGYAGIYATAELLLGRLEMTSSMTSEPEMTRLFQKRFPGTVREKCGRKFVANFESLKPGTYYIIVPVFWRDFNGPPGTRPTKLFNGLTEVVYNLPLNFAGGTYMLKVTVAAGDTLTLQLNNDFTEQFSPIQ